MLLSGVHIPAVYDDVPDDPQYGSWYCSLLVHVLEDAFRNCVLLVDANGHLIDHLRQAIDRWPPKHTPRAQLLLTELHKRRRLIEVPVMPSRQASCGRLGCDYALAIVDNYPVDFVLYSPTCTICPHCQAIGSGRFEPSDYAISSFATRRRTCERLELANGQWHRSDLERELWVPIFRHAKHIKVFDRYVGRHVRVKRGSQVIARQSYLDNLAWIYDQFVTSSAGSLARTFQVTCGIDTRLLSGREIGLVAQTLRQFARNLARAHGVPFDMRIKLESPGQELPHARYVITDQLALLVERGTELLRPDDFVQDVVIALVGNAEVIEREASALPDAP